MSSSALIAARKRVETSLKKFEVPTQENSEQTDNSDSGVLYLSLLQSRLNWSTSVFVKYKPDLEQQPRRAVITRRKWPNMKYLGHCTLHIGPHIFEDTSFYEAIRSESWQDIIKAHQDNKPQPSKKRKPNTDLDKKMNKTEDTEIIKTYEENKEKSSDPKLKTKVVLETNDIDRSSVQAIDTPNTANSPIDSTEDMLIWTDIVFEFKDVPSERYIFPKESLVSIDDDNLQLRVSFTLPFDPKIADEFSDKPINKLLKHGQLCNLEYVQSILEKEQYNTELVSDQYEPVNMLLSKPSAGLFNALSEGVDDSKKVQEILEKKTKLFPPKNYIQYNNKSKSNEMAVLLNRVLTMPDLLTGPIMAEKKRNEILNAIKLGKRERDEKFEAELPKTKLPGVRDESVMRCGYCATKYTTMWRSGPGGHGTLCNSCGLQWKRGEILDGAEMISIVEERKALKEKREREKLTEASELERLEKESKKHHKKQERGTSDTAFLDNTKRNQADHTSTFATQLIQQRQAKNKASSASSLRTDDLAKIAPSSFTKQTTNATLLPAPCPTNLHIPPPSSTVVAAQPYSLYSSGGIPLPTLSIDFGGMLVFSHPNCGITLLDSLFSIRLCKEEHEQMLIQFDKKELVDSTFLVFNEIDNESQREVLKMTIPIGPKIIQAYGSVASINRQSPMVVRFLEKLDPQGGAVVQRILQRWLTTFAQQ
ncbi:hypothetical protein BY458DRAFT_504795 [Sporodiniella umbellata]|nr:hypothetical protein BY458DRAFT_504795 [Sporodiniella umbellata]